MRIIGIRQIKKNGDLTMGTPQKDISKYEKVISCFGNVAPAVVASNGEMYDLIDGQARIEAYRRTGAGEIPVVVAATTEEPEQLKLSLLLSVSREQGCALSEGALIEKLVNGHCYTLGELSALTSRSKAWLSKRQAMARNLSPVVKNMVMGGAICTRSAEEVAKLPQNEQAKFASNIVKEGLNKDEVFRLSRLYRSYDATPAIRRAIVDAPAEMLPACPQAGGAGKKMPEMRVLGAAYYIINLLDELCGIVCKASETTLAARAGCLLKLQNKMRELINLIAIRTAVSPGKEGAQAEGGAQDD